MSKKRNMEEILNGNAEAREAQKKYEQSVIESLDGIKDQFDFKTIKEIQYNLVVYSKYQKTADVLADEYNALLAERERVRKTYNSLQRDDYDKARRYLAKYNELTKKMAVVKEEHDHYEKGRLRYLGLYREGNAMIEQAYKNKGYVVGSETKETASRPKKNSGR